jgi:hypothetical protein
VFQANNKFPRRKRRGICSTLTLIKHADLSVNSFFFTPACLKNMSLAVMLFILVLSFVGLYVGTD